MFKKLAIGDPVLVSSEKGVGGMLMGTALFPIRTFLDIT